MSTEWHAAEYPLRFQFGDRTLFTRRLKLQAMQLSLPMLLGRAEWHALQPSELPKDIAGCLVRSVPDDASQPTIARVGGYLRYVIERGPRYYADLSGTFDEYVQKHFSSKSKGTLQRKIRKFSEFSGGTLDWRSYRGADDMPAFHASALAVSDQTYQEKLFGSGLPRSEEFIAELQRRAQSDSVRAYVLFSQGTPVAYLYLPAEEETLIYAYLGFAPAFREWSVGTILHWFALKDLFGGSRFRYLDFTEGDGEHKKLFATGSVSAESILFLRDSLIHRILLRAHSRTNGISAGVGLMLERMGIKSVAKRVLRYGFRGLWRKAS